MNRRRSLLPVNIFGFRSRIAFNRILLDTGAGEGGGGAGGTENEQPEKPKTPTMEEAVKKHGGAEAALMYTLGTNADLSRDNWKQREEIRDLRSKLPASGARVLTAEEATAFDAYRALGAPDAVKKKVTERDEFETKVKEVARSEQLSDIAEKAGKWDAKRLKQLVRNEEFVEVDAKDKDGGLILGDNKKPKRVIHVKGEGEATTPIEVYYKDFLSVLAPEKEIEKGTPSRDFSRTGSRSEPEDDGGELFI